MNKISKDEKGFTLVETLLIILVVAVIALGGYYVWHTQHKSKTGKTFTASTSNSTTSAKTVAPSKPVDPTADWATYTSQAGGFSFKYPASGWTLTAYNSAGNKITGSAIPSNASQLSIDENPGQGLSTSKVRYSININIGSLSSMSTSTGEVTYGLGTILETLSNGIQVWQTTKNTFDSSNVPKCGGNSIVMLGTASSGNLYVALPNGQYLNILAGFCDGPEQTLTLNYQQQVHDAEMTVAKNLLASIKYQ